MTQFGTGIIRLVHQSGAHRGSGGEVDLGESILGRRANLDNLYVDLSVVR